MLKLEQSKSFLMCFALVLNVSYLFFILLLF